MPKETLFTCDICGDKLPNFDICGDKLPNFDVDISHGKPSKKSIQYIINVNLKVQRYGPVNSVSEPHQMKNDFICLKCYYRILRENLYGTSLKPCPKIVCPFTQVFGDDVDCPYLERGCCDEIDINCGNGDAWCTDMIGGYLDTKKD